MNFADLYRLAVNAGFPAGDSAVTAAAIALAESGGNPQAVGDLALGGSYGLWQVNHPAHPQYSTSELLIPEYNAQAALAISNRGTNWAPWSTYTSGAYRRYLAPAPGIPTRTVILALAILAGSGALALYIDPQPLRRLVRALV